MAPLVRPAWKAAETSCDDSDNYCLIDKVSFINIPGPDGDDDTDRGVMKSAKSRSSSVPAHKNRSTFSTPKPPSGESPGCSSVPQVEVI